MSAPLLKRDGYDIDITVDDDGIILFTGKINPKRFSGKAVNQIWNAMFRSARALTDAWEKNFNE